MTSFIAFKMKNMISKYISILLLLFAQLVFGQSSFLPQNLGKNVNSESAEINPIVTPDGQTLYFNRLNHQENTHGEDSQDIWFSTMQSDGTWSTAKRLETYFNKDKYNAIVCALNNETFLIEGIYSKGKTPKYKKRGFSIVTKSVKDEWGAPQKLKVRAFHRLNEGVESNAWMNADKNALVLSFTKSFNGTKNDLYASVYKNGHWTRPKKLSKVVNSRKSNEEAPFIASNNETMYFTSNRGAATKEDRKFNYQIFKTSRLDDTWRNWSVPVALTDTINSKEWDSYFRTNEKGSIAYFTSTKSSLGEADIYKIKLFEENPYVIVKGTIINKQKNAPLEKSRVFSILTDNLPTDSVWINADSSTYKLKFPLNKKYFISASVKNFNSFPETIDVLGVREYTEITKDLYVEPIPFVHVTGNVLTYAPRGIVPESVKPQISINGKVIDSIKINFPEGSFEMLLPYGKSYNLAVNTNRYVPMPVKLDLTKVEEFQDLRQDLFVRKNPVAIVSGSFFVKGTTSPIKGKFSPKLVLNGEIVDSATIDTAKSTYKIILPLERSYQIALSATKYQGITVPLDLSTYKEQIEIKKDLFGTFVSTSAIVKGKVINRKTNLPLTGKDNVKIQSNGLDVGSARYYPNSGEYEMELGLGVSHTINANLPQFLPQYETIDLTKEKGSIQVIKDLYVTPLEVGQSVKLNNIFFETGKATMKTKSFPELNKVVKFLNDNPTIKIQIEGHTDNVGKVDANLKLSKWRARSVQQYLAKKGIDIARVKFEGYGSSVPVAKNTTAAGKSLNRRVEFKILSIN